MDCLITLQDGAGIWEKPSKDWHECPFQNGGLFNMVGQVKLVLREFINDHPFQKAAAISYYTLLSLAPLLLVVIGAAAIVLDRDTVQVQLLAEIQKLVGNEGAEVARTVLERAGNTQKGVISLAIGLFTLFLGATTVFIQLQTVLNQIWKVKKENNKSSIWAFFRKRVLSLTMILGIGFLLLVSLLASSILSAAIVFFGPYLPIPPVLLHLFDIGLSIGIITLLVAMMFKYLPDAPVAWKDVWIGAAITALLFTMGKFLIGLYLGHASIGSAYGAAGSVIVLMVWVNYATLIILLGAEITRFYSQGQFLNLKN
jgi:membrane protein